MKTVIILFIFSLFTSVHAITIDFAKHYPNGFYLSNYLVVYEADAKTDHKGNDVINNLDLNVYQYIALPTYYHNDFVFFSTLPFVKQKVGLSNKEADGFGDITLSIGYFFPITWTTLAVTLGIKTPTGDYKQGSSVNLGTGAYETHTALYLHHEFSSFSIDSTLKYKYKHKNDYEEKLGNETLLETVLAYRYNKEFSFGPSVIYSASESSELNGIKNINSKTTKLSIGGDIKYRLNRRSSILLNVMQDMNARNSIEGQKVFLLLNYAF